MLSHPGGWDKPIPEAINLIERQRQTVYKNRV